MILLFLFAFISGLITILAPCIWPLLPVVLGSSTSGGARKSLGITVGICLSFAIFTLTISYLVKLLGFDPNILRLVAVVMIAFLGLSLVVPSISAKLEVVVSRFSGRLGNGTGRNGFWGGLITGVSLGLVWSPCAGPILATIATAATTATVGWQTILVMAAYIVGVGIPLFFFTWAGNWLFTKTKLVSPYLGKIQQGFGIVIILLALAIYTNYDKVIEIKLLDAFPGYTQFVNQLGIPASGRATDLVGKPMNPLASDVLPNLGHASEFTGINKWLNTEKPLTMAGLRGKVVLVDFWTYTCINCIRTLPHLNDWYQKYAEKGLVIIGVHTPEFEFEKKEENVVAAIAQYGIKYPVALDNDYATWNAYANHYWPAEYLIDAKGIIRREHFGEGEYDVMEEAIQKLLVEAGLASPELSAKAGSQIFDQTPTERTSPETYLGSDRMVYHYPVVHLPTGTQNFILVKPPVNSFSFGGIWTVGDEYSMAGKDAVLDYNFQADKVYLVMRPGDGNKTATVKVFVDGKLSDIITVDSDRLYTLVDLKGNPGNHLLHLEFMTSNAEAYAFTFG